MDIPKIRIGLMKIIVNSEEVNLETDKLKNERCNSKSR